MRSEGYGTWSVSLSVRLSTRVLALQATRWRNSDTNGFIATLASFKKRRFSYNYTAFKSYGVKSK